MEAQEKFKPYISPTQNIAGGCRTLDFIYLSDHRFNYCGGAVQEKNNEPSVYRHDFDLHWRCDSFCGRKRFGRPKKLDFRREFDFYLRHHLRVFRRRNGRISATIWLNKIHVLCRFSGNRSRLDSKLYSRWDEYF